MIKAGKTVKFDRKRENFCYVEKKRENLGYFRKKKEDFGYILKNLFFSEKRRLEGTMGKFCDFISEKGCLEGTSENFEKNKVQREKWPVPSNGPPCNFRSFLKFCGIWFEFKDCD